MVASMNLSFRIPMLTSFVASAALAGAPATAPAAAPATEAAVDASPVSPPPATGIRTFELDAKASSIVIQVFKTGAAAALAHDHVVDAREFSGSIVADAADVTTARVEVTAQTASFINDDPKLRSKYGLDPGMSDKDRKSVEENMKAEDQLDVKSFPIVKFVSTSVSKAADGKATLAGKLTLHGVTLPVSMPLDAKVDANTITGNATFRVNTSAYGITPFSALLGAVKNKDEIVIHLHLVAIAK